MSLRMICSWPGVEGGRGGWAPSPPLAPGGPRVPTPAASRGGPVVTRAPSERFRDHTEPSQPAPRPPQGAIPMSTHPPVRELLGIDHPIVQAPVAGDPRLPAAVSNAGGLGSL